MIRLLARRGAGTRRTSSGKGAHERRLRHRDARPDQPGLPRSASRATRPRQNTVIQFTGYGKTTRVKTTAGGQYRVRLKPGRYAVSRPSWGPGSIRPASIRVPAGRFTHVNLFIDTGIR